MTVCSRQRRQRHLLLLSILLLKSLNTVCSLPNPFRSKNAAARPPSSPAVELPDIQVVPTLLGEEDDEEETDVIAQTVAAIQIIYGTALILYGRDFPEQILVLTMMKATGFATIETAVRAARKNLRKAIRFAVWRAPSFFKLRSSILHIHERIGDAKRELAATRKAKEDGVITPGEERHLRRMHKRDIRKLRRDRAQIQRGMISLIKIIHVLDLKEIFAIIESFFYQFIAVLAAGHSQSKFCIMLCSWCLFLSLGSLLIDCIQKLINSIIERQSFLDRIQQRGKATMGFVGKTGIMALAFYLVEMQSDFARRLNAALLEAAIVLHGLRYFVDAVRDRDEDAVLATLAKRLERSGGGLLLLCLASASLYFANLDNMWAPRFLLSPMEFIEDGIAILADVFR